MSAGLASKSRLRSIVITLTVAGLLISHLYVSREGLAYSGPLLFVDHLFDLGIVVLLVLVARAFGGALSAGVGFDRPVEDFVFSTAIGFGAIATTTLLFSLTVSARPWPLLVLMIGLCMLFRRGLLSGVTLAREGWREIVARDRDPVLIFGLIISLIVITFLFLYASAPPTDWDTLTYHLTVPGDFLTRGQVHVPEANLHVSRTGLLHFLYMPLMATQSMAAPALLSAVITVLLCVSVFSFCDRFLSTRVAAASLASFWGTTTFVLVSITPRIDLSLAFFLFLAHYALIVCLQQPVRYALYIVAAVLLGFAIGVKISAVTYVIGLSPLIIWAVRTRTQVPRALLRDLLRFGLVIAVVATPWLYKNWSLLGAPFHPFLSPRILQPWLAQAMDSFYVPASIDPAIFGWEWDLRNTFNLRDAFFAPGRLTIEVEGNLYFLNPILLALPIGIAFLRRRIVRWLLIPGILSLLLILIPFPYSNPRYLLPSLIPLVIVALFSVISLTERVQRVRDHVLLIPILVATLLPTALGIVIWTTSVSAVPHFLGASSRKAYLEDHPFTGKHSMVVNEIRKSLPDESRIVMLYEARSFYFDRVVLQDNLWTNWPLLAEMSDAADCRVPGDVTHVLINMSAVSYLLEGGMSLETVRWDEWEVFRDCCLRPIYSDGEVYTLFEVMDEPRDSEPPPPARSELPKHR